MKKLKWAGFLAILTLFLGGLGIAEAQQTKKVYRVGFLCPQSRLTPQQRVMEQGLRELGYVEGKNIVIESRFAKQRLERLPDLAAELVRLKVDVIVPMGSEALHAAHQATKTIPIVMPGDAADPVAVGFIASLARPGGNITGLANPPELSGKRLELLKEAFPKVSRVALLWRTTSSGALTHTQAAAQSLRLSLQSLQVQRGDDIDKAFAAMAKERADALMTLPGTTSVLDLRRILELAAQKGLPAIYPSRQAVEAGGLMSYGRNWDEAYRRGVAFYVDKILKGAKPADLPVEQPTKFEPVINLKTAKQIGLTIPQSVLYRADKVIK